MRRNVLLVLSIMTLVACGSILGVRGSGTMTTETREVTGITGVDLAGQGRVEITVGDADGLSIEAEDNLMTLLTSEVRNGILMLGNTKNINPTQEIVYSVTMKNVEHLAVSGSGQIQAPGLQGDEVTVDVSGSGEVRWSDVMSNQVDLGISGSGHVVLTGETDHLVVSISGSGSLAADALTAASADIDVSGSGDVTVNVTDDLVAAVSGSGSIEYLGDPQVEAHVSGSGSVKPR